MLCHCRQGTDYRTILKEERDSMMKINKDEQDFVLKYFQPGKLDTRKALQKVKARVGIADEEVSHAATVSLRMRRIRWIAVAASILVLFILNVTPDSFYSGSRKQTEMEIAQRANQIIEEILSSYFLHTIFVILLDVLSSDKMRLTSLKSTNKSFFKLGFNKPSNKFRTVVLPEPFIPIRKVV